MLSQLRLQLSASQDAFHIGSSREDASDIFFDSRYCGHRGVEVSPRNKVKNAVVNVQAVMGVWREAGMACAAGAIAWREVRRVALSNSPSTSTR
jgi:hypothetical protein